MERWWVPGKLFSRGNMLKKYEFYIALIVLGLCLVIGSINPAFFTLPNFFDILRSSVVMMIFAMGVLMVLVSGGIDISFTAIAAFCMYVTAQFLNNIGYEGSIALAFLLSAILGLFLGLINAVLISTFRLPTLIVTLGTANMFRGFLLAFIGTRIVVRLPPGMIDFARWQIFQTTTERGGTVGLSFSVILLLIVVPLVWWLLNYTMLGRGIFAIGGDRVAAERAGLNIKVIQFFIYCFVGTLAGVAGIVHSSLIRNANPFDLVGLELSVIAAVVLGGARISGGHGTIIGTILGVFLVVITNNSLILMGIPSYWQTVAVGAIIVIGTGITALQGKRERRVGIMIDKKLGT
ncbi:MAG TPA: ABC transporter permease [Atribacteraceae bacterium]|nr:ABC transporter permease [Atribacteraceae bacterium]